MKFKLLSSYFAVGIIVLSFLFASKTNAVSPSSILVNMAPENPAPYENVDITLNSYVSNLDSVLITWSVDGKKTSSGIGKKAFSVRAPAAGAETTVIVDISLPEGSIATKILIRPSTMILLWQATDSFVPPFYKGKALPTPDSEVKVVAMPEIKTSSGFADFKNMTYSWQKDYTNDTDSSGYGKNSFLFVNDYLDDSNNVSVVASTTDQKYLARGSIDIGMTQPKIVFYKNDNNFGTIFEKALENQHKVQNTETIVAIPYFISPKELLHPKLIWNWSINDNPVTLTTFEKNIMPLKVQEGTSGISKIDLEIRNQDKIFESVSKEINIEF